MPNLSARPQDVVICKVRLIKSTCKMNFQNHKTSHKILCKFTTLYCAMFIATSGQMHLISVRLVKHLLEHYIRASCVGFLPDYWNITDTANSPHLQVVPSRLECLYTPRSQHQSRPWMDPEHSPKDPVNSSLPILTSCPALHNYNCRFAFCCFSLSLIQLYMHGINPAQTMLNPIHKMIVLFGSLQLVKAEP